MRRHEPAADAPYVVRVLSGNAGASARWRWTVGSASASAPTRRTEPRARPGRRLPAQHGLRDTVGLRAFALERGVTRGRLLVRDPHGRVVAGTALVDTGDLDEARLGVDRPRALGSTAAPGPLTVEVRGTDLAGNRATSRPFTVRVSRRVLGWRDEVRTVVPAETVTGPCTRSTANGCGDVSYCGTVVPSTLFVGGLSLRSAACSEHATGIINVPGIVSLHVATVPDAVRGIDSYRVAFTARPPAPARPTRSSCTRRGPSSASSSAAQTPW